MKIIYELIAGSKLYGLDTPESDTDTRGVFVNTELGKILGIEKQEVIKENDKDTLYYEICHYLKSLRKTNTQAIELLFAESFLKTSEEFQFIQNNKLRLIDSEKLFYSLIGYIENEKRLANGDRQGDVGSKRRNQIEKFGFSPKNFSHMIRLAFCGSVFFRDSFYPVDIRKYNIDARNLIFSIKTEPQKYNKEMLNEIADEHIENLKNSFKNRKENFVFDVEFANRICLKCYSPHLSWDLSWDE